VSEYYGSKTLVKRINDVKLFRQVVGVPELPRFPFPQFPAAVWSGVSEIGNYSGEDG
jgi:hypothetical protein